MKKILFLMLSFAFMFTACEDKDAALTQGLVGTWYGTTMVDGDEAKTVTQFFADENTTTGKFVEVVKYYDQVEEYDIAYSLPYIVYVGGEFRVKDGYLKMTYDTTSVEVDADADKIRSYILEVLAYDREQDENRYAEYEPEKLIKDYTKGTNVELSELWTEVYKESNADKSNGFSDLQVDEKSMSYTSGDLGKLDFTRADEDMYKSYPLDD